jgi:hypothetical protein
MTNLGHVYQQPDPKPPTPQTPRALADVLAERFRQEKKWGQQDHDPCVYLTILGEEYGEMCRAAIEARVAFRKVPSSGVLYDEHIRHLREEAVQTAAVALAIIECLDRGKWNWPANPT